MNVLFNSYDEINQAVSPLYHQVKSGHCSNESFLTTNFGDLAATPPDDLTEQYYKCFSFSTDAFFNSIGVAWGNVAFFSPLILIFCVVPFIKSFFKVTGVKIEEEKYSEIDREKVAKEFAEHILLCVDGTSDLPKNSLLYQLACEMKSYAAKQSTASNNDNSMPTSKNKYNELSNDIELSSSKL